MGVEGRLNRLQNILEGLEEEKHKPTIWYQLNMTGKDCPLEPGQKCPMAPGPNAGIVFTFCETCPL